MVHNRVEDAIEHVQRKSNKMCVSIKITFQLSNDVHKADKFYLYGCVLGGWVGGIGGLDESPQGPLMATSGH